jgi:hypothetical protein
LETALAYILKYLRQAGELLYAQQWGGRFLSVSDYILAAYAGCMLVLLLIPLSRDGIKAGRRIARVFRAWRALAIVWLLLVVVGLLATMDDYPQTKAVYVGDDAVAERAMDKAEDLFVNVSSMLAGLSWPVIFAATVRVSERPAGGGKLLLFAVSIAYVTRGGALVAFSLQVPFADNPESADYLIGRGVPILFAGLLACVALSRLTLRRWRSFSVSFEDVLLRLRENRRAVWCPECGALPKESFHRKTCEGELEWCGWCPKCKVFVDAPVGGECREHSASTIPAAKVMPGRRLLKLIARGDVEILA